MRGNTLPGVSVIVCCYNSALRLPSTLKYIALQEVPALIKWEVIIVNNNSNDNTEKVATTEWNKYSLPIPFKVVSEPRAGLVFAKQKGIENSEFDILLFCDDDNWLEKSYIYYAYTIMCANEKIEILGGRSAGFFEGDKPFWFDKFQQAYAVGIPLKSSGIANQRTFIAGAGMVVRRSFFDVLYNLDFKPLLTGRKGLALTSGEDSELCLIAMFLGYDLYYDDKLQFTHFISKNRLSWSYCVNMISKGHSIPQIYFELYSYCYRAASHNEEIIFHDAFTFIRKKLSERVSKLIFGTKPFGYSFKLLMHSEPGSRKELEIKSLITKLIYLFKYKKTLKEDFHDIVTLIKKIYLYNTSLPQLSKTAV